MATNEASLFGRQKFLESFDKGFRIHCNGERSLLLSLKGCWVTNFPVDHTHNERDTLLVLDYNGGAHLATRKIFLVFFQF